MHHGGQRGKGGRRSLPERNIGDGRRRWRNKVEIFFDVVMRIGEESSDGIGRKRGRWFETKVDTALTAPLLTTPFRLD
jgi:hypothetical protein